MTLFELLKEKDLTPFYLLQMYLAAQTGDDLAIKKIPRKMIEECLVSWERAIAHIQGLQN